MDYVITTRELAKWLKEEVFDFNTLTDASYDELMGTASGAGAIFGNTGGVMEAVVRNTYYYATRNRPPDDFLNLQSVRGMDGIRNATVTIAGTPLRVAVVHGINNAKQLIDKLIADGFRTYDLIEVMSCRGGCIGGGGQPKTQIPMTDEIRKARINGLYKKDSGMAVRFSVDNPDIKNVYRQYYKKPISPVAKRLLHTSYYSRSEDLGPMGMVEKPLI